MEPSPTTDITSSLSNLSLKGEKPGHGLFKLGLNSILLYWGNFFQSTVMMRQLCKKSKQAWDDNLHAYKNAFSQQVFNMAVLNGFSEEVKVFLLQGDRYWFYYLHVKLYSQEEMKNLVEFLESVPEENWEKIRIGGVNFASNKYKLFTIVQDCNLLYDEFVKRGLDYRAIKSSFTEPKYDDNDPVKWLHLTADIDTLNVEGHYQKINFLVFQYFPEDEYALEQLKQFKQPPIEGLIVQRDGGRFDGEFFSQEWVNSFQKLYLQECYENQQDDQKMFKFFPNLKYAHFSSKEGVRVVFRDIKQPLENAKYTSEVLSLIGTLIPPTEYPYTAALPSLAHKKLNTVITNVYIYHKYPSDSQEFPISKTFSQACTFNIKDLGLEESNGRFLVIGEVSYVHELGQQQLLLEVTDFDEEVKKHATIAEWDSSDEYLVCLTPESHIQYAGISGKVDLEKYHKIGLWTQKNPPIDVKINSTTLLNIPEMPKTKILVEISVNTPGTIYVNAEEESKEAKSKIEKIDSYFQENTIAICLYVFKSASKNTEFQDFLIEKILCQKSLKTVGVIMPAKSSQSYGFMNLDLSKAKDYEDVKQLLSFTIYDNEFPGAMVDRLKDNLMIW